MTTYEVVLPYTPPSLNRAGRGHPVRQHRVKTALQRDLEMLLMAAKLPRPVTSVFATAVMRFPTSRRRDEGNHRWLLEKAMGDALVNGGWLADDTPIYYRFGRVTFSPKQGPCATVISLQVVHANESAA